MVTLQSVAEIQAVATVAPWPVSRPPAWSWLVLDGAATVEDAGLFVALLAERLEPSPADAVAAVDALAAEEMLILGGGLRVLDTATGAAVTPGCCCGLEDWREWELVLDGVSPWFGHDPSPSVETDGELLRVRQDEAAVPIEFPRADLPALLDGVRADLTAFLGRLAAWAPSGRADALVELVDRHFHVSRPAA